jgi:hypothetical protein
MSLTPDGDVFLRNRLVIMQAELLGKEVEFYHNGRWKAREHSLKFPMYRREVNNGRYRVGERDYVSDPT